MSAAWMVAAGLFGMGNVYSDSYYDDDSFDDQNHWNSDEDYSDNDWDVIRGRPDSKMSDRETTPPPEPVKPEVKSLFDLAARVTAMHVSCEELEGHSPPLDEQMLKRVAFHACPTDPLQVKAFAGLTLQNESHWTRGEQLAKNGQVRDMTQVGFMVAAVINNDNYRETQAQKVSFTFEKQRITSSSCETCPTKLWCTHIVAAVLYRINHAKEVAIHAPVTETLSTLSRDQLQKLVQYAINEDPNCILEKVFKHIGEIRDVGSDINATAGAPDPTFGIGMDQKSSWDLSLDQLKDNFEAKWRSSQFDFVLSYQESAVHSHAFYQTYLQKVVDLVLCGAVEAAGRVLIQIVTSTVNAFPDIAPLTRKQQHFLHTLEKLCCHYIMSFPGPATQDLVLVCQQTNSKMIISVPSSTWADVPPPSAVRHRSSTDGAQLPMWGGMLGCLYEPLCASQLPGPSQAYHDLITGEVDPVNSEYDEEVAMMMLRFEALRRWGAIDCSSVASEQKQCRLAIVILRKLLIATYQHSVLSSFNDMNQETKLKKRPMPEEEANVDTEPPKKKLRSKRCGKSKTKSKPASCVEPTKRDVEKMDVETVEDIDSDSCAQPDVASKKLKSLGILQGDTATLDADQGNMSAESLSHSLLHMCYYMYTTLFKTFSENIQSENTEIILAAASLRALELAKLHTCWPIPADINLEEHLWLEKMEQQVADSYFAYSPKLSSPEFRKSLHKLHKKALLWSIKRGVSSPPSLQLIHMLISVSGERRSNHAMALCVSTVCYSYTPLQSYTIPDSDYGISRIREKYFNKFSDILSHFLDKMDKTDDTHKRLLLKVLKHYQHVKDGPALYIVFTKLREFSDRILLSEDTQVAMTKLLIHCIKLQDQTKLFKDGSYKLVTLTNRLSQVLGTKFRDLTLPYLEDLFKFFGSYRLSGLLQTMFSNQQKDDVLPSCLVSVILSFLGAKFEHSHESSDILVFLESSRGNHNKALKIISDNAQSYSYTSLLQIAKKEHERSKSPSRADVVFTVEVHNLITSALAEIGRNNKDKAFVGRNAIYGTALLDIEWVFKAFTDKNLSEPVAKGKQFTELTSLVIDAFPHDVQTLVALCSQVEVAEPLLEKCKEKFGDMINKNYQLAFVDVLRSSNHKMYDRVVTALKSAHVQYNKYVRNGSSAFTDLVKGIRKVHKGKKKLLQMMDHAFPVEKKTT